MAPASARTCSLPLRACSSQLPTSAPPCVWAGEGDGEEAGSVLCGCPRAASRHRAGSPGVDYLVHGPCAKKPSSSAGFSALITSRFAKMFEPGTLYQKKKYLPYRPTCLFRRSSDMFSDCWFPLQVPAASGAGSDQARSQTLHLNLPPVAGAQAPPGSLGRELARQWSSWDWNPRSDVECDVLVARPAVSPPPWTSRAVSPPTRYAAV